MNNEEKFSDLFKKNPKSLFFRKVELTDEIKAPRWLIDGIIPEGIGVISGSGGVGKTTAIVPLALRVIGISQDGSDITVEAPRKVIYITEDESQVILILNGMRKKLAWGAETWEKVKENFIIFNSLKLAYTELSGVLTETMIYSISDSEIMMPLIIFDTSSSNFMVKNENDNSEISSFMETLRHHYREYKASLWLINHLTKTSRGQTIDDMMNMSARGGGAWQDEAMWTAILSTNLPDGQGERVLKLVKRRVILEHDEIRFPSTLEKIQATNRFGKVIHTPYFYCTPQISSERYRKSLKHKDHIQELKEKIIDAMVELGESYPSRNDVFKIVKGSKSFYVEAIDSLIFDGVISENNLPAEFKKSGKSKGLTLKNGGAY
jgi:RecA-family ATPase